MRRALRDASATVRHTVVTDLAESGAGDQTVVDMFGHVSKDMLEHYSHIRMKAKRQAVEALTEWVQNYGPTGFLAGQVEIFANVLLAPQVGSNLLMFVMPGHITLRYMCFQRPT